MTLKVHIKNHERGLLLRDGDVVKLLRPGNYYRFWEWLLANPRTKIDVFSTLTTYLSHPLLETFIHREDVRAELEVLTLTDAQRALVWRDERLTYILGPGRHALWKVPYALRIETFDIGDVKQVKFEHRQMAAVMAHPEAVRFFEGVQVTPHEEVLVYRDGVLIDRVREGLHVYWKGTGKIAWKSVDLREQVADVAGQEIMTSDKVTLRVNLVVTYQVLDALAALGATADYTQALYREAQLVLRAAVGTRPLDALLADKESIGGEVATALVARTAQLGVAVKSVGLRDIILPGDMKELMNRVIAATKEAEANLIKRREETAAARSQANTARVLAENPQLARLKELELLGEIMAKTKATFVLGPSDLSSQIKTLVAAEKEV
jgi:regulator of protease activity HflC (stomatin/prohibitin superfamily)